MDYPEYGEWVLARDKDIRATWERIKHEYKYAWFDLSVGQWLPDKLLTPSILDRELSVTSGISGWHSEFDGKGRFAITPPPMDVPLLYGFDIKL